MTTPLKICAVLTVFNRRQKTLSTLRSFFNQGQGLDLSAVLMDDGSTDGTTEAVQAEFHNVTVLKGSGSLYWNRGMAAAFKTACSFDVDYYLWLNDDTKLTLMHWVCCLRMLNRSVTQMAVSSSVLPRTL